MTIGIMLRTHFFKKYSHLFALSFQRLDPQNGKTNKPSLDLETIVFTVSLNDHALSGHVIKDLNGKWSLSHKDEGVIKLCVSVEQQVGQKYIRPALVAFRVKETGNTEGIEIPVVNPKAQNAAKEHMSEMERVLGKMIKDVNLLLNNADSIKDEEQKFHKKSEEMNAASKWWPVLQLCVLLATGFTQVNHIVKFFKGRHII